PQVPPLAIFIKKSAFPKNKSSERRSEIFSLKSKSLLFFLLYHISSRSGSRLHSELIHSLSLIFKISSSFEEKIGIYMFFKN
ncbi:MAG: hypothetical protein ACKPKO_09785, partial [Candidatus Fonsibacter sp.]